MLTILIENYYEKYPIQYTKKVKEKINYPAASSGVIMTKQGAGGSSVTLVKVFGVYRGGFSKTHLYRQRQNFSGGKILERAVPALHQLFK